MPQLVLIFAEYQFGFGALIFQLSQSVTWVLGSWGLGVLGRPRATYPAVSRLSASTQPAMLQPKCSRRGCTGLLLQRKWGVRMRTNAPASRGAFRIRFSPFDTVWALCSPIVALALREAQIISVEGLQYCFISIIFSLVAYSVFRLHDGVSKFFTVNDAWKVVRAVAYAELATCILLFTFTRLDNIPRSTPIIHALILCAGLIAARALARLLETDARSKVVESHDGVDHVIMIGATELTFRSLKTLAAYRPGQWRVIGLLDSRAGMKGRTISGIRIIGAPDHLQPIIDEFAEHGISTDRVVVGGDEDLLPEDTLKEVQRVCKQREIPLEFVPKLFNLSAIKPCTKPKVTASVPLTSVPGLSPYFKWKYAIDFVVAGFVLVLCAPILLLAGALAVLDVGWPVVFWQQRLGTGGRAFTIWKIRTLRPPFDQFGQPIPENKRNSWVGSFLRRTRLDELPQLANVLVGDMFLIGPRPLLPRDQPTNPTVRLTVRPGITGWAQVNGGTLISPSEKDALDEWYVRNASFWLDLRITMMTLRVMIWGQRRSDRTVFSSPAMRGTTVYLDVTEPALVRASALLKNDVRVT
jgi:lipopolysaccharide/colanic/teichoic acid biosynthesis glycosyltransferase